MPQDRKFPPRCPNCTRLLADSAKPHCDWKNNRQCSWMRCKCGMNIAQASL
jgi:hypothetical protein